MKLILKSQTKCKRCKICRNCRKSWCVIILDDTTRKPCFKSSTSLAEISYRSDRRVGGSPWFTSRRSDSIKV